MALLGIDVGTTACKAAAFTSDGKMICMQRKEYGVSFPHEDYAELSPDDVWNAVCVCIRGVAERCDQAIEALSVSSQGEGIVPLNGCFAPVGPIFVSFDLRARRQTDILRSTFGSRYFFDKGGQILVPMGSVSKIMWMLEHPEYLSGKPERFACVGDFVLTRLGVPMVTDPSMAARTMMYDIAGKGWNGELLRFVGLNKENLCEIVAAGTDVGIVPPDTADSLGLGRGVRVVVGGHDQPCAMLGAGAFLPGHSVYSLGTTETLVTSFLQFNEKLYDYGLPCYPHVLKDQFITLPGNFTGGNLLQWYRDTFASEEKRIAADSGRDAYELILEEMDNHPSGLYVLPHFTMTGSPWNDGSSCGLIAGLKLSTTKGQFIRALLEGVTYEIKLNLKLLTDIGIPVSLLYAVGGGTKSDRLLSLKSNVLSTPIIVPDITEAPCRGAAYLAAAGSGYTEDMLAAWRSTAVLSKTLPDHALSEIYNHSFATYQRLYPCIKSIFK